MLPSFSLPSDGDNAPDDAEEQMIDLFSSSGDQEESVAEHTFPQTQTLSLSPLIRIVSSTGDLAESINDVQLPETAANQQPILQSPLKSNSIEDLLSLDHDMPTHLISENDNLNPLDNLRVVIPLRSDSEEASSVATPTRPRIAWGRGLSMKRSISVGSTISVGSHGGRPEEQADPEGGGDGAFASRDADDGFHWHPEVSLETTDAGGGLAVSEENSERPTPTVIITTASATSEDRTFVSTDSATISSVNIPIIITTTNANTTTSTNAAAAGITIIGSTVAASNQSQSQVDVVPMKPAEKKNDSLENEVIKKKRRPRKSNQEASITAHAAAVIAVDAIVSPKKKRGRPCIYSSGAPVHVAEEGASPEAAPEVIVIIYYPVSW